MRGQDEKVLAIFCADIHLSLKPPVWRSAEPDWFAAQARPLLEIQELQNEYKCPVICAGDIFDRYRKTADGWNAPPELINFAINYLPDMHAIPGQHDLPNHQYDDIERSAYWTLVKAGKINNMAPASVRTLSDQMVVYSLPYLYKIEPCLEEKNYVRVAVVHDYIWIPGHSYPDAPDEKRLKKLSQNKVGGKFYGYDVVVYGDNHKGFSTYAGKTQIFNCGTLMRRKSDEIDYRPQVGLLLESGEVVSHYLDTSEDKYITAAEVVVKETLEMGELVTDLQKLGKSALDFVDAMKQYMHKHGKMTSEAKQVIIEAMEK